MAPSTSVHIPSVHIPHPSATTSGERTALTLWHLLSLDAPSIAVLWTWFIADAVHLRLPADALLAMFLAVWILYAGDRLLDARCLSTGTQPASNGRYQALHLASAVDPPSVAGPPNTSAPSFPDLEERHFFHARHRTPFLIAIALATLALGLLLPSLPPAALRLDLMLGALLAGYFLLIHATPAAHRLPKEIAVGIFFSAAVFIPTVSRLPALRTPLILSASLFAALCSLNCLCIYAWEHESLGALLQRTPRVRGDSLLPQPVARTPTRLRPSPDHQPEAEPHRITRIAVGHLALLHCLLAGLAVLASLQHNPLTRPLPCGIALSTLLLWVLGRVRHRFTPVALRAAADLALATPLCVAPLFWLLRG